jgi:hypothetical protein
VLLTLAGREVNYGLLVISLWRLAAVLKSFIVVSNVEHTSC